MHASLHKTSQEDGATTACAAVQAHSTSAGGKVRRLRLRSGGRVSAMATSGGGERERRKRRAWRQPRHEPGSPPPLSETAATRVPAVATEPGLPTSPNVDSAASTATDSSRSVVNGGRSRRSAAAEATAREEKPRGEISAKQPPNAAAGDGGPQESMVEIDGSAMEGGGQILRNAVTLGCLVRRPVRVVNVRGGRSKPGLRHQHLAGLRLIGQLCGGKLAGDDVNSTRVEFWPGSIRNGDYSADTQTAGSTTLLLQVSLPCLLFAPPTSSSTLTLRGGTNADMAPPIDYITKVFKPTVKKFGVTFDCELKKRGFYPRGGGEVVVKPHPLTNITPATITEPGQVVLVSIHSYVAGVVAEKIASQMAQAAKQQVLDSRVKKLVGKQLPGVAIETKVVCETADSAFGNGSGIIVVAETSTGCLLGGSANGKREEPPYKTGRAAADEVLKAVNEGACVDEHMQDQLILFMALAKGRSVVRTGSLSLHTKTAIHIARTLTSVVFNVRKLDGGAHLIECDGIGLQNAFCE